MRAPVTLLPQLRFLDLDHNRLGTRGAKAIAEVARSNQTLESVALRDNGIAELATYREWLEGAVGHRSKCFDLEHIKPKRMSAPAVLSPPQRKPPPRASSAPARPASISEAPNGEAAGPRPSLAAQKQRSQSTSTAPGVAVIKQRSQSTSAVPGPPKGGGRPKSAKKSARPSSAKPKPKG